ncbi:MAG: glycerate dehydrogenase [Cytophagaceae bacterium SCN 52-12]|nr:MAG: glycerate dehydrogenase [Cytophagaceae bacterium SCN 52-12]
MNIIVLDGYTLNPGDLEWTELEKLGNLTVYDRTPPGEVAGRAREADAVIVNKQKLNRETLAQLPQLKYIGVSATGVNNVDLAAAKEFGISVTNVGGYSTNSVAQHTFGLILALTNHIELHSQSVFRGEWVSASDWSYTISPLVELNGKSLGLIGLGSIGEAVANIALSFGMKVSAYRKNAAKGFPPGIQPMGLQELFGQSDIVSLHCPLTPETEGIVNAESLSLMKTTSYLINTGRGPLIVEEDLAAALHDGKIAGAGLDVLSDEPPKAGNPLLQAPNCIITPHNAWASFEARKRLMSLVAGNLKAFLEGNSRNVVV